MPDYREAAEFANYWRTEIIDKLQHAVNPTSFPEYMAAYYKYKSAKTYGLPTPYSFSLEFLDKYKDRCITFEFNGHQAIAQGAPPLAVMYQLSPTMHAIANVSFWRDKSNNEGHLTLFFIYENLEECVKFLDNNKELLKKPQETPAGFVIQN